MELDGAWKEASQSDAKALAYMPDHDDEVGINEFQIQRCADAIIDNMSEEDIELFDKNEPEYAVLKQLKEIMSEEALVNLALGASIINYQLGTGGADAFWPALQETVAITDYDYETPKGGYKILKHFLNNYKVNNRIRNARNKRLDKWYKSGFSEWLFENYDREKPMVTWYKYADSVDAEMFKKTIEVGMKQLDIIHFLYEKNYIDFKVRVPIPVDIQVRNICSIAAMVPPVAKDNQKVNKSVRLACQKLIQRMDDHYDLSMNVFRVDSILFQLGQKVQWSNTREENIQSLTEYITEVTNISEATAREISAIFTTAQRDDVVLEFDKELVENYKERKIFHELIEELREENEGLDNK